MYNTISHFHDTHQNRPSHTHTYSNSAGLFFGCVVHMYSCVIDISVCVHVCKSMHVKLCVCTEEVSGWCCVSGGRKDVTVISLNGMTRLSVRAGPAVMCSTN